MSEDKKETKEGGLDWNSLVAGTEAAKYSGPDELLKENQELKAKLEADEKAKEQEKLDAIANEKQSLEKKLEAVEKAKQEAEQKKAKELNELIQNKEVQENIERAVSAMPAEHAKEFTERFKSGKVTASELSTVSALGAAPAEGTLNLGNTKVEETYSAVTEDEFSKMLQDPRQASAIFNPNHEEHVKANKAFKAICKSKGIDYTGN